MIDLRSVEKYFLSPHIKKGGTVVDFTMGNGHDTVFLSNTVGVSGKVYAFDIQQRALEVTEARLTENGCPDNCVLICDSHSNVKKYVTGKICAGVFNLGYLPGSGNKALTTKRETTLKAVKDAVSVLDEDGGILIAVYPGHEEGRLEGELLAEYLGTLDRKEICVSRFQIVNSPESPYFFLIER